LQEASHALGFVSSNDVLPYADIV